MAFDQGLAERIRNALDQYPGVSEKKMFGGLAFMCESHMFVGIVGDVLMARVGVDQYKLALAKPHVREMDFTGKPMNGYVFIDPPGFEKDEDFEIWISLCHSFVQTLPAKAAKPPRKKNTKSG